MWVIMEVVVVLPWVPATQTALGYSCDIQPQGYLEGVCKNLAYLGFPVTYRMGVAFREAGQDPVVFCFSNVVVFFNDFFQRLVLRTVLRCDGDQLPGVTVDAVQIRIHHDIEAADLIGTGSSLYNRNTVYFNGFFQ